MSTISFIDEPGTDIQQRPAFRYENSYQMTPGKRFPKTEVQTILQEVIESYLSEEKYEPELCRQMSKTLSEVRTSLSFSKQIRLAAVHNVHILFKFIYKQLLF